MFTKHCVSFLIGVGGPPSRYHCEALITVMGDIAENNYNQRSAYYRDNDHHDRTKSIINTRMTTTKIREAGCSKGSSILPDHRRLLRTIPCNSAVHAGIWRSASALVEAWPVVCWQLRFRLSRSARAVPMSPASRIPETGAAPPIRFAHESGTWTNITCRCVLSLRFFPVPYIRVPDAIILFLGIRTIPSRM